MAAPGVIREGIAHRPHDVLGVSRLTTSAVMVGKGFRATDSRADRRRTIEGDRGVLRMVHHRENRKNADAVGDSEVRGVEGADDAPAETQVNQVSSASRVPGSGALVR